MCYEIVCQQNVMYHAHTIISACPLATRWMDSIEVWEVFILANMEFVLRLVLDKQCSGLLWKNFQ